MEKSELQSLIANSETEKALDALLALLPALDRKELLKTVILQKSKFTEYDLQRINNLLSPNELRTMKAQIDEALLTVIDQLPGAQNKSTDVTGTPSVQVTNSKNVATGPLNVNTGGGDFHFGDSH